MTALWTSVFYFACLLQCVINLPNNNSQILTSTYSKVAHWGSVASHDLGKTDAISPVEGRSNSGQTLWTHRVDANVRRKAQPRPYYHAKLDTDTADPVLRKGEIQERFNPRPYFDFVTDRRPISTNQENTKLANTPTNDKPSVIYGVPADSFPLVPKDNIQPASGDVYSSPYDSYNPPDIKPGSAKYNLAEELDFPPNDNQQSPQIMSSYIPANQKPQAESNSYGGPQLQATPGDSYPPAIDAYGHVPPSEEYNQANIDDSNSNEVHADRPFSSGDNIDMGHQNKKPESYSFFDAPPKIKDDIYNSGPLQPEHIYVDNSHHASYMTPHKDIVNIPPSLDYGPVITQTVEPPGAVAPPYMEHPPSNHETAQFPPSDTNLSPPSLPGYGKIPEYLEHDPIQEHNFQYNPYFDHHPIYHEIHTTTTTQEPEHQRVNSGHYSYYYLGRKLWYIPLYFSIYFIVYITILILKSIARHKIQFSHNFDKSRSSRGLDVNDVHNFVTGSINNIEKKYIM